MRSLAAWLGFLALVSGGGGSDRLLAAPLQPELDVLPAIECTTSPPAINWVCVNEVWVPPPGGEVTPPPPESTPRVISVGEEVTGTLQPCCSEGPAVFEILFELTAPSDGTLVVHLSSDAYLGTRGRLLVADVEVAKSPLYSGHAAGHRWSDLSSMGLLPVLGPVRTGDVRLDDFHRGRTGDAPARMRVRSARIELGLRQWRLGA